MLPVLGSLKQFLITLAFLHFQLYSMFIISMSTVAPAKYEYI